MKSFVLFLCVIVALFAFAQGNDCTIDDRSLEIGETYSLPGKCQLIKCTGKNSFSAKTCASAAAPDSCEYIPQDNSKPYPECCPSFKC